MAEVPMMEPILVADQQEVAVSDRGRIGAILMRPPMVRPINKLAGNLVDKAMDKLVEGAVGKPMREVVVQIINEVAGKITTMVQEACRLTSTEANMGLSQTVAKIMATSAEESMSMMRRKKIVIMTTEKVMHTNMIREKKIVITTTEERMHTNMVRKKRMHTNTIRKKIIIIETTEKGSYAYEHDEYANYAYRRGDWVWLDYPTDRVVNASASDDSLAPHG